MSAGITIFKDDELKAGKVLKNWTAENLLNQDGVFFLKDIVGKLELVSAKVIQLARQHGDQAYTIMGVRKIFNHWAVRMKVFAPFYRARLKSPVRKVDPTWDGNTLLGMQGIFLLSEVCDKIPFSTYQIRYQAKTTEMARERMGVWKDPGINRFVVDMAVFQTWIKHLWRGDFGRACEPPMEETGEVVL